MIIGRRRVDLLEAETTDHLGYDSHDPMGRNGANSRNGTRAHGRSSRCRSRSRGIGTRTFEPGIVRKRQRRLDGVDQIILSLSERGLTTVEIAAHFADLYGATIGKDTISKIP